MRLTPILLSLALPLMGCDDAPTAEPPTSSDLGLDATPMPDQAPPPDRGPPDTTPADAVAADTGALVDAAVDATPTLAPQNAFGPVGRINRLEIPDNPEVARRQGCLVRGPRAGTGAANGLMLLGGGLNRSVQPNRRGEIDLVLLIQAKGWAAGTRPEQAGPVDLALLDGVQAEGELWIDPATLTEAGEPQVVFPGTPVDGGWLDQAPAPMNLSLTLLGAIDVQIPLEVAQLNGRLVVDGPGLGMEAGVLTGYITDRSLEDLVDQIRTLCRSPDAPSLCALFGGQIEQPTEELVELVLGFLDGYDAAVYPEGYATDCEPGGLCNAIALCVEVGAEGVVVQGVAP